MFQNEWSVVWDPLRKSLEALSYANIAAILCTVCWLSTILLQKKPGLANAPVHGYRSMFEPSLLLRARFITGARDVIMTGYERFKEVPFVIKCYKYDLTILPVRYLDEVRTTPASKLDLKAIHVENVIPRYTYAQLFPDSDLHFRVVRQKLGVVKENNKYFFLARSELNFGWERDIPQSTEWIEIDIQKTMRGLIARMFAKIFLGNLVCRDADCLQLLDEYTMDFFLTAFTLKMFPAWAHPIVARFIPARHRLKEKLDTATRIVEPLLGKHLDALNRKNKGEKVDEEDTLLHWLIDNSTPKENNAPAHALRILQLTLASIHSTAAGLSNVVYDLVAHPEWIPGLVEEIAQVTKELGNFDEITDPAEAHRWLSHLEKLDSFIVEVQRHHPAMLLIPQRMALEPLTFKDGLHVPAGTRVAWATHARVHDPEVTPNPDAFDPMRSYRKRHQDPSGMALTGHQAVTITKDHIGFGHGVQACPGRFLAVNQMKTILMRLLIECELQYPEGKSRPRSIYMEENAFPDPSATLMIRRKVAK